MSECKVLLCALPWMAPPFATTAIPDEALLWMPRGRVMTIKTAFVVQPFTTEGRRSRRLIPLPRREVQSEEHARHQAEYLATRRAGAVALALTVDTASGTMRQMRVLASFGNVPDDLSALTFA